jgi:CheY-like chemotaxis protein
MPTVEELPELQYWLPGSDGYDLIGQIRALKACQGRHIPAAAITAYLGEDREKGFSAGFEAYWDKLS